MKTSRELITSILVILSILCGNLYGQDYIIVYPTGSQSTDYESVQNAIDNIEPGGTVFLEAGIFDFGSSEIIIGNSCTVEGAEDPVEGLQTITKGHYSVFRIWCGNVNIRNLIIKNDYNGPNVYAVSIESFLGAGGEVAIEKNYIYSASGISIFNCSAEEIVISKNTIEPAIEYGYDGIAAYSNDCEISITKNIISNYAYCIRGISGLDNHEVIISKNNIYVPFFAFGSNPYGTGIQIGNSMYGWNNCKVEKNTLLSYDDQEALLGIAIFPYSENNEIIDNDLTQLRTNTAQVTIMGRNNKVEGNKFGFANCIPSVPYGVTHVTTAISIWSVYIHPYYGNSYPDAVENNYIASNNFKKCGLAGWEQDESGEPYGGCILLFCYPETDGYTSGPPNEVKYNYIDEKHFPSGTGPEEQILIIPAYSPSGEPLIHDNIIIGLYKDETVVSSHNNSMFMLHQNFPNPPNPQTTIKYSIMEDSFVELAVYDQRGQLIEKLENGFKSAGSYSILWDATGLPHGIYFYSIKTNGYTATKKIVHTK